jgi:hypothetical protein
MNRLRISIIALAMLMPAVALANTHYGYTLGSVSVTPTTVAPGDYITVEFEYTVYVNDGSFTSLWAVILGGVAGQSPYDKAGVKLAEATPSTGNGSHTFTVAVVVQIPEDTVPGDYPINIFSCAASYQPVSNFKWYFLPGTNYPIEITVEQDNPIIEVGIDIKPGSYPNSINLGSQGVVPVAILSSGTFDATQVDPDTVTLAGATVAVRGKSNKLLAHEEDVNDDGLLDLVCQVDTENLDPGIEQDGYAILEGNLLEEFGGTPIEGSDEITIVPPE